MLVLTSLPDLQVPGMIKGSPALCLRGLIVTKICIKEYVWFGISRWKYFIYAIRRKSPELWHTFSYIEI